MGTTATADALVDAAEELFARQGFEGASLRAVMRAAGSDPGAIHYHFGGRRELAGAVLDRVLAPLNARRIELLEADEHAAASDRPPGLVPLERLLEAIIRPDVEAATNLQLRGIGRGRLIGAIYLNPAAFVTEQVEQHFRPVAARFFPHFSAALPDLPATLVSWRIRWAVFGMVGALLADDIEPFALPLDELVQRIVPVAAAAVGAPASLPGGARFQTESQTEEGP